jgi:hypothetical protein
MSERVPDAVVCDIDMPNGDGLFDQEVRQFLLRRVASSPPSLSPDGLTPTIA